MNCNYKGFYQLNPHSRKELLEAFSKENKRLLSIEYQKMLFVLINNLYKLFVVASHEECQLGKSRIDKILKKINELLLSINNDYDECFIKIEEACKQILGTSMYNTYFKDIPFNAVPKNFDFLSRVLNAQANKPYTLNKLNKTTEVTEKVESITSHLSNFENNN